MFNTTLESGKLQESDNHAQIVLKSQMVGMTINIFSKKHTFLQICKSIAQTNAMNHHIHDGLRNNLDACT